MDGKYEKLNVILIVLLILLTLVCAMFNFQYSRIVTYLAVVVIVVAPFIFDKIVYKTVDKDKFIYYVFIFFAYFLGCVVNLYNTTKYYDILMHFLSGVYSMYIAFKICDNFEFPNNSLIKFLFCFGFLFFIAGLWEIGEFSSDMLFNTTLQHNIEVGVVDTMIDIISAVLGGIITYIIFSIKSKKTNKKIDKKG